MRFSPTLRGSLSLRGSLPRRLGSAQGCGLWESKGLSRSSSSSTLRKGLLGASWQREGVHAFQLIGCPGGPQREAGGVDFHGLARG